MSDRDLRAFVILPGLFLFLTLNNAYGSQKSVQEFFRDIRQSFFELGESLAAKQPLSPRESLRAVVPEILERLHAFRSNIPSGQPLLIFVDGPPAIGKSQLTSFLEKELGGHANALRVNVDHFLKHPSQRTEIFHGYRKKNDAYHVPDCYRGYCGEDAVDLPSAVEYLTKLREKQKATYQGYQRNPQDPKQKIPHVFSQELTEQKYIIMEGMHSHQLARKLPNSIPRFHITLHPESKQFLKKRRFDRDTQYRKTGFEEAEGISKIATHMYFEELLPKYKDLHQSLKKSGPQQGMVLQVSPGEVREVTTLSKTPPTEAERQRSHQRQRDRVLQAVLNAG